MTRQPISIRLVFSLSLYLCGSSLFGLPATAQSPAIERTPILLDTGIGNDVDDALALALIFASPELNLRGVVTSGTDPARRALLLSRFHTMTGRRHIPIAAGFEPAVQRPIAGQFQYYYHPDVIFNRTTRPVKENAVDFMYSQLKAQPGKITIVAIGPLTNIARLIEQKPDCKTMIKRIIVTEGVGKANLTADRKAADAVLQSGIPQLLVPAAVTLRLDEDQLARLFSPGTALSLQCQALHQLSDESAPVLSGVLAVGLCLQEQFFKVEDRPTNASRVAVAVREKEFAKWYIAHMAGCVRPEIAPASIGQLGKFPTRVHVAEYFDNDIERKWWMAGKPEAKNVPPGSLRACRGVLTHDFDDLLGNPKAMYTAVVFNPVPGPPMGKNTRLTFKYWLKGSDKLRVQIYSLTNGYHRHLILDRLPEGKWQSATVAMTAARRPDGTGGPLSEGERIDDIQFYTDAKAELIIDDIVLYDLMAPDEKRPFPKRILFTGLFDSGKQGKEWPGSFEIVQQKGFFWHGAKSVANTDSGKPWIRLGLRGERRVGDSTHLFFRYRLSGANAVRVGLVNRTAKTTHFVELKGLANDQWKEATADFDGGRPAPKHGDLVDEVQFLLPTGAELIIDDVLLYEL